MQVKGKIVGFEPDFSTHKPKLILELTRQDNLDDLFKLREEPMLDIKISKPTQKRSRDANSYAWVLMGQIAELINSTKEDVYKEYIRQKGIYREITLNNEAVNTFTHLWTERGLGWICEHLQSNLKETTLLAYYGSSSYNTKQMASFIDYVVQEAKELGIQTETPDEIERMKALWKAKI